MNVLEIIYPHVDTSLVTVLNFIEDLFSFLFLLFFGDFVLNLNIVTTLNIGNNKALSYVILANSLEERPLGNC